MQPRSLAGEWVSCMLFLIRNSSVPLTFFVLFLFHFCVSKPLQEKTCFESKTSIFWMESYMLRATMWNRVYSRCEWPCLSVFLLSLSRCSWPRVLVFAIYVRCQFNAASMLFLCSSHCLTIEDLFPLLLCKYAPLVILPFHSMYVSVMYLRCDHMFFCSAGLRAFYISLLISNSADIVSLLSICRRYIYMAICWLSLYIFPVTFCLHFL